MSTIWACFTTALICLIIGTDALGRRPFQSHSSEAEYHGSAFGKLGLPCALAGEKCFDKKSMCADMGAGKKDVCQCKEGTILIEGKCRPNPALEENITAASFGGCPYAAQLAQQYTAERNQQKQKMEPNAATGAEHLHSQDL